jgi:hypothetical protein
LAVVLLVLAGAPASAHGDERVLDGRFVLEAGGAVSATAGVHYHRVVGRVVADGPVVIRFVQVDTGRTVVERGPGTDLRLDELIRCCDEDGWTPHRFVLENPGELPLTVTSRVGLVHDDVAVMIDGAESGTRSSLVVIAAGWAALAWRAARKQREGPLHRSVVALGGLVAVSFGLAWYGTLAHGGGDLPMLGAAGDLPVLPVNPLVSRSSLTLAAALLVWGASGLWWIRARTSSDRLPWLATGLALVSVVGYAAVRVVAAYDRPGIVVVWMSIAAVPLLATMAVTLVEPGHRVRASPRRDPSRPSP